MSPSAPTAPIAVRMEFKDHPSPRRGTRRRASPALRAACLFPTMALVICFSAGRAWLTPRSSTLGVTRLVGEGAPASSLGDSSDRSVEKETSTNAPERSHSHQDTNLSSEVAEDQGFICDTYFDKTYPVLSVVLLCWGIFYMFWALAIVCDEYFVASLEVICERLRLSDDVAGATFMAAGSSAPELFTSLMGVFAVHNDVGVGTIVGSAVFNLTCIIGGTAFFAPRPLQLDWRPLARDSFFYAVAIVVLIVCMRDNRVTAAESMLCVGAYAAYVVLMAFNASLLRLLDRCFGGGGGGGNGGGGGGGGKSGHQNGSQGREPAYAHDEDPAMAAAANGGKQPPQNGSSHSYDSQFGTQSLRQNGNQYTANQYVSHYGRLSEEEEAAADSGARMRSAHADDDTGAQSTARSGGAGAAGGPGAEAEEAGLLSTALKEPIVRMLQATIPDTRVSPRYYVWAFSLSCFWIGALSYLMVTWATKLGCLLHIHPAVMGVTVLAAGTSVPDAMASLIVAARGQGDMAVSNAIGSNVFDILLGLGLPWAISTVCLRTEIEVDASNLTPMAIILFGTLAVIYTTIALGSFRLTKRMGVLFFSLYVLFCAYVLLGEFGLLPPH